MSYLTPHIHLPQPYGFEWGEESKGDVSAYVDKWHEAMSDVDKQDGFIESEDPIESIIEPTIKVNSPNLESVDPTSLHFSGLTPNPSLLTHSTPTNYDHFSNAPKCSLFVTFVITYFVNN